MDNLRITTESEQMYLVSMARLAETEEDCPIPLSQVAELLGVTPISTNQMIHHLEEMGLVSYTPYQGVEFTDVGWKSAAKIMRSRRLWEVFLVEHLQYDPGEAEVLACTLEHAIPEETADRLANFLGYPVTSPAGKTIPQIDSVGDLQIGTPLNILPAASRGIIVAIQVGELERAYFRQTGLALGSEVTVLASQDEGPCLVKTEDGKTINLSSEYSKEILVKLIT
ncbi:MAG: metal-dependent transcriptional regulator [Anaerolineales bacterium]|nr:metal-dependent transcriptional regulator [Anaerolineales bacterium]